MTDIIAPLYSLPSPPRHLGKLQARGDVIRRALPPEAPLLLRWSMKSSRMQVLVAEYLQNSNVRAAGIEGVRSVVASAWVADGYGTSVIAWSMMERHPPDLVPNVPWAGPLPAAATS